MFSRSRLSRDFFVGGKCRSAITPVRLRLASSGQGGDEAGGGVPVDQHHVRSFAVAALIELIQQLLGQAVKGLALGHDIEVFVHLKFEGGQDLPEHRALLERVVRLTD